MKSRMSSSSSTTRTRGLDRCGRVMEPIGTSLSVAPSAGRSDPDSLSKGAVRPLRQQEAFTGCKQLVDIERLGKAVGRSRLKHSRAIGVRGENQHPRRWGAAFAEYAKDL